MGEVKDSITVCGGCIGTIVLIFIIVTVASAIIDMDLRTSIENNTTITMNDVEITVPETANYTINESTNLCNINDTDKFGIYDVDNITGDNAWYYEDPVNNISLYVADANRTAYTDIPDFSELEKYEAEPYRTHIEKRNVGDKVVYLTVKEGKGLSKLIADSAVHV